MERTINKLKTSERITLKKLMRSYHGAATEIAAALDIQRPRLYDAIKGNELPAHTIGAIRTYLSNQSKAA